MRRQKKIAELRGLVVEWMEPGHTYRVNDIIRGFPDDAPHIVRAAVRSIVDQGTAITTLDWGVRIQTEEGGSA